MRGKEVRDECEGKGSLLFGRSVLHGRDAVFHVSHGARHLPWRNPGEASRSRIPRESRRLVLFLSDVLPDQGTQSGTRGIQEDRVRQGENRLTPAPQKKRRENDES